MLGTRQKALAQQGINRWAKGEVGRELSFLSASVQEKSGRASCMPCAQHPETKHRFRAGVQKHHNLLLCPYRSYQQ